MKKSFILLLLALAIACPVFAEGSPNTYTQEIILIAIIPPASEVRQVISANDTELISSSIRDLYVDNGVVVNLINMSPDTLNEIFYTCISKIAEEISRGAFHEGSSAGMLIRTSSSQFKISQDGVAYTALDSVGQGEIKRIIKSLIEDYYINSLHYASEIVKVH
ncbi:MAG: hypothetical protein IJ863_05215 [Spirochaetales bacterium]|nr:hypothetical protein [Spirochaetales bacterium]